MSNEEDNNDRPINWKISILLCLLIGGGAWATLKYIYSTEPKAQKVGATKKTAMLVEVFETRRGSYHPTISVLGKVEPAIDIMLSPQVDGEITYRAPNFTPGGFIKKDDILFKINQEDYQNALALRKIELLQAKTDLQLEMGRQNVALQEFKILNQKLSKENEELILRKPQLDAVKAKIEYAKAAIDKAEIDLSRTTISAPFDAQVLTRNKDVGSQVSSGETLGRMVGLDEYWVMATMPLSKLKWLDLPGREDKTASEAKVRDRAAWAKGVYRTGKVSKLIGTLEDETRLAQVLITVKDPLSLKPENSKMPKLIIGAILKVDIIGKDIQNAFRLERKYVRNNDSAWVNEDGKLKIKKLKIVLRDAKYAYVTEGLNDGDKVIKTNLSRVVDGARLRLEGEKPAKEMEPAK